MIKLSDYLDYLSNEVIQARKNMDLHSIENAKFYSEHEYLKYFKAPRFTMPTIKLEIPIEISALDSETKYNFQMNEDVFLHHVNKNISTIARKHNISLKSIAKKDLSQPDFLNTIKKFEKDNQRYIADLDFHIIHPDIKKIVPKLKLKTPTLDTQDFKKDTLIDKEVEEAIANSFKMMFKPSATKLNNIYISPDTGSLKDINNDQILVKLNVELVEENLKITKMKDADGREYEEIVLDQ